MIGETIGLVCDVKKLHVVKVKYNVKGREYFCYKWLNFKEEVPHFGDRVIVVYNKEKPSRSKIKEFCQKKNSR